MLKLLGQMRRRWRRNYCDPNVSHQGASGRRSVASVARWCWRWEGSVMPEEFTKDIERAIRIRNEYGKLVKKYLADIRSKSDHEDVRAIATNFIYSGVKLAGQILNVLKPPSFLQLAVVGSRTHFEMMVDANYIFNHKENRSDQERISRLSSQLIGLTSPETNNHARYDRTNILDRAKQVGMECAYEKNYRQMSEWTHRMIRTVYIDTDIESAKMFGSSIACSTVVSLHNTYDAIASWVGSVVDQALEESVIKYSEDMTQKYLNVHKASD